MENHNFFTFLILGLIGVSHPVVQAPPMPTVCLIVPGDINIGLLTGFLYNGDRPETEICANGVDYYAFYSLMYYEAFRFAIDLVNSRSDILPNITLGYAIHDTCWSELGALAKAQLFVPSFKEEPCKSDKGAEVEGHSVLEFNMSRSQCDEKALNQTTNTTDLYFNSSSQHECRPIQANSQANTSDSVYSGITPETDPYKETIYEGKNDKEHSNSNMESNKPYSDNDWNNCLEGSVKTEVVAVVDPVTSPESMRVSQLLGLYEIPVLSTRATFDELSDKTRYPYFLRLSPPDNMMVDVLFDCIAYFNWTYISVLYPDSQNGAMMANKVQDLANSRGLCIPVSERLPPFPSREDALKVARLLKKHSKAKVVISFIVDPDKTTIYDALKELDMPNHFIWLSGDTMLGSNDGAVADGAIMAIPYSIEVKAFTQHFFMLTPENNYKNPWMWPYWDYHFNCSSQSDCDRFKDIPLLGSMHRSGEAESLYIDAVFVYANALDKLIRDNCPLAFQQKDILPTCIQGRKLLKYIRNTSILTENGRIKFNQKGDRIGKFSIMQYNAGHPDLWTRIGVRDFINDEFKIFNEKVKWKSRCIISPESQPDCDHSPVSICSAPCKGEREYQYNLDLPCCWQCWVCAANHVLGKNKTTCDPCALYQWPDDEALTGCSDIKPYYLTWGSPLVSVLSTISLIGVGFSIAIGAWLYINRAQKLVKASSLTMNSILLCGTGLAYGTAFPYFMTPTDAVCVLRKLCFDLAVGCMYIPLFIKSLRVYRIFKAGRKGISNIRMVSNSSQVLFTVLLLSILVFIEVIALVMTPTVPARFQQLPTIKEVEFYCHISPVSFIPPTTYIFIVILLCAVCGFLIRRLPDNFNESWFIFISVTSTLFLWLVFIPAYVTSTKAMNQIILIISCLLINSSVTLVCLFLPKIYAVHYHKDSQVHPQPAQ